MLNTTTAKSAGNNVRNNMVINVNSLIAIVNDEGDEGDAIDSNGSLTINGGTIYAFSHSSSQDAGLDSEDGTIINGGTVIATGNMADSISSESKQNYIYVQFNQKIESDTLLAILDQNDNVITAFKTSKSIKTLFYTSETLEYESFKIYSGGEIEGNEENGLYTGIKSYTKGNEVTYTSVNSFNMNYEKKNNINDYILKQLIVEIVLLVIFLAYAYFLFNKKNA